MINENKTVRLNITSLNKYVVRLSRINPKEVTRQCVQDIWLKLGLIPQSI